MSQIALPFSHQSEADPSHIVIGNANADIIESLRQSDRWPYRTAVLSGPARSGKSLFGRWFSRQGIGEVIDNASQIDETDLFHRWNRVQEQERPLLLINNQSLWDIRLPDLRSRLGAALHLEIDYPDDEMAAALLESHAMRRGIMLGESASAYLLPRMERSFSAIERVVSAIDRLTLERKQAPTLSIWRDALESVQGPEQGRLL
ncbi:MAG: HdaA/DnaA family protein [Sphingomonadaceae bacterium]